MIFYLVTIKNNRNVYTSISHIDDVYNILRLQKYGHGEWSDNIGYELDSKDKTHMHTIVCFPNNISIKKFINNIPDGYMVNLTRFPKKDYDKVANYVLKEHRHKYLIDYISMLSYIKKKLKKINLFKCKSNCLIQCQHRPNQHNQAVKAVNVVHVSPSKHKQTCSA